MTHPFHVLARVAQWWSAYAIGSGMTLLIVWVGESIARRREDDRALSARLQRRADRD